MATYSEIRDMVGRFAKRSTGGLPMDDFMTLAFSRISREILPNELDGEFVFDLTEGVPRNVNGNMWAHPVPVPFNRIWAVTNNGHRMRSVRRDAVQEWGQRGRWMNQPSFYALTGMELWVAPGQGADLRMVYNAYDNEPADPDDTNIGLTYYPDAYLHAGLAALYQYVEDEENEDRANARYSAVANAVNLEAERRRRGGGAGGIT